MRTSPNLQPALYTGLLRNAAGGILGKARDRENRRGFCKSGAPRENRIPRIRSYGRAAELPNFLSLLLHLQRFEIADQVGNAHLHERFIVAADFQKERSPNWHVR